MTDDDLSRDLQRIASWGDPGSVPPIDELAGRPVRVEPPRAAPSHRRWLLAAAAAAVILVVAAIVGSRVFNDGETTMATDPDANVVQLSPEPEAMPAPTAAPPSLDREWIRIADPPLSARGGTIRVWTGEELLVAGGSTLADCPSGQSCDVADDTTPTAAAYDPATDSWRRIADLPVSQSGQILSSAIVGEEVFVMTWYYGIRLLRYSLPEDRWDAIDVADPRRTVLVAMDDRLLLARTADPGTELGGRDGAVEPDVILNPSTGEERPLPADPLAPADERSLVWDGEYVYLFTTSLGSHTTEHGVARFDPVTWQWEQLEGEGARFGPARDTTWLIEGDLLVPQPNNGVVEAYDTTRQAWVELVQGEFRGGARVIGVIGS
ncbi:MAG: hypothetical protein KDB21_13740, partial [Acidimicrobiales bacterium]|nr:hypothetical protein [Acidimicrobiales bacterium]